MTHDFQAERQRAEEANRKIDEQSKRVVGKVEKEFKERQEEILRCVNETRHALELLVPRFDVDKVTDSEDYHGHENEVVLDFLLKLFGFGKITTSYFFIY